MLILQSFFQFHQFIDIDLLPLLQLLIGPTQAVHLPRLPLDPDRRRVDISTRVLHLLLLDGVVGVVFGCRGEVQLRNSYLTIHLFVIINYSSSQFILSFYLYLMRHKGQRHRDQVDSDSSSDSSEDNLDSIIQGNARLRVGNHKRQQISSGFKIFMGSLFAVLMVILAIYIWNMVSQTDDSHPSGQTAQNKQSISNSSSPKEGQVNKDSNFQPTTIKAQTIQLQVSSLSLTPLTDGIQLNNAIFISKITKNGTNHWFVKQNVVCIPEQIVNSATKIKENLFAQATAYEDINILTHKVDIPAENMYIFESPRQFLYNASLAFKEKKVAYDHYSPLLLVLIIRYFTDGIYVSTRNEWPLLQNNLIFNDAYPLANPYSHQTLISSDSYQILVTYDLQLAIQLIVSKNKQIIVVLDFLEPTKVKTAFLLKMKIYKLEEGLSCHERGMTLFEEGNWRIDEQAYLLPGWYILTVPDNDISFGLQHFNYEVPLVAVEENRRCKSASLYNPKHSFFSASKANILKLPYSSLNFFSKEEASFQTHYRSIYAYFDKKTPKGSVFLDSGSTYLLLVTVFSLPPEVTIYLNEDYQQRRQLMKNLVLNNLERVQLINKTSGANGKYSIIITADIQTMKMLEAQIYIFQALQETPASPELRYSQLVQAECFFEDSKQVENSILSKGIYLIQKRY